ncbi:MAG: beta-hydroxyacyl-ACP dehydratase [Planctomycetes bacterium]|nr:beta-hydroxyacyl-ACP dehydratase [Planctomycetota bacterium]
MPPPAILDPSSLKFDQVLADREEIMRANPQRHEFQLLDAIIYRDDERGIIAGYHDVKPDAFWVRGHIPGRPLLPGVLMIEVAAQLCSYMHHSKVGGEAFLGFAGVEGVKFRGAVVPPSRLVLILQGKSIKPRRVICYAQGFVGDTMVFEGARSPEWSSDAWYPADSFPN